MNLKNTLKGLVALGLVALLAGCNTVAGAGKDIQRAGQGIEDTARDCGDRNGC